MTDGLRWNMEGNTPVQGLLAPQYRTMVKKAVPSITGLNIC